MKLKVASMLVGIVGKANVGKSTFFKALTLAEVLIANYPFATVKPNRGFGFVKVECVEREFNVKCTPRFGYCIDGWRFVPVELLDVAGLVPGAHAGKGMGNQFLDDLRQAHALIHVVDMAGTTNEVGEPVEPGSYDPAFDIKFLEFELDMWYLAILKKGWDRFARTAQQTHTEVHKALAKQLSGLNVTEHMVKAAIHKLGLNPTTPVDWSEEDLHKLAVELRKATKPMVIAANKADLPTAKANIERCKALFPDYKIIPCSSEAELALREAVKHGLIKYVPGENHFEIVGSATPEQRRALEYVQERVLKVWNSTGVQETINTVVFDLLNYIAVFPVANQNLTDQQGRVLPDCLLLPPDSTALDLAAAVHTDLAKKFIAAVDLKTKLRVGKEAKLKNMDVMEIITGR